VAADEEDGGDTGEDARTSVDAGERA
jgi:hypothetical protein